jgi:hypothetical protein
MVIIAFSSFMVTLTGGKDDSFRNREILKDGIMYCFGNSLIGLKL